MTERNINFAKIAVILGLYILVQVLSGVVALVAVNWNNLMTGGALDQTALITDSRWIGRALFFANLLMMGLMWVFRLVRRQMLPTPPLGTLRGWGLGFLAFFLVVLGVNGALSPLDLSDGGTTAMFQRMSGSPVCFLSLTLVGPVAEEFVFREGVLRHLKLAKVPMKWAIILSAAIFAILHFNWAQSIPAFILGCALGILYARTNDIRLSAAAHVVNNTLAVLTFQLADADELTSCVSTATLLVASSALFMAGVLLFVFWWKRSQPQAIK